MRKSEPYMRPDGYWFSTIAGKRHYLGKDEHKAREKFHTLMRSKYHRTGTGQVNRPETLSDVADQWLAMHDKPMNRQGLRHFVQHCGMVFVGDIDPDLLSRYVAALKERFKPETIRNYVGIAKRLFRWAAHPRRKFIEYVPDAPKLPKSMLVERDADDQILGAVLGELKPRTARIFYWLLWTGARPGEACRLEWKHVQLDRGRCVLPEHKTAGSTGRSRVIRLTPDAADILREMGPSIGSVFVTIRGGGYSPDSLRTVLRKATERARKHAEQRAENGCEKSRRLAEALNAAVYPYQLRHTFAQRAYDQDNPLEVVGSLLGHSSTAMTQRYAQVREARTANAVQTLRLPLAPKHTNAAKTHKAAS